MPSSADSYQLKFSMEIIYYGLLIPLPQKFTDSQNFHVMAGQNSECELLVPQDPGQCDPNWTLEQQSDWFRSAIVYGDHFSRGKPQTIDILCDGSNAYEIVRDVKGNVLSECLTLRPEDPSTCTTEWTYHPDRLHYRAQEDDFITHEITVMSTSSRSLNTSQLTGPVQVVETYYTKNEGIRAEFVVDFDYSYNQSSQIEVDFYKDSLRNGSFQFESRRLVPVYLDADNFSKDAQAVTKDCSMHGANVLDAFVKGLEKGVECIAQLDDVFADQIRTRIVRGSFRIICSNMQGTGQLARVSIPSILLNTFSPRFRTDILFDPSTDSTHWEGVMFHELLHVVFGWSGGHKFMPNGQPEASDRVYGCHYYCFDDAGETRAAKHCRACLDVDEEDPRCKEQEEPTDCLYECSCPSGKGYYSELSECLSSCQAGLSCVGGIVCERTGTGCLGN